MKKQNIFLQLLARAERMFCMFAKTSNTRYFLHRIHFQNWMRSRVHQYASRISNACCTTALFDHTFHLFVFNVEWCMTALSLKTNQRNYNYELYESSIYIYRIGVSFSISFSCFHQTYLRSAWLRWILERKIRSYFVSISI